FSPSGPFGIKVSLSYTDRTRNVGGKIGIRIWKAVDANGNIIPNTYIMAMDYLDSPSVNYDYNDNVYYVSNIKPENGSANYSELASAPSAVTFGSVLTGSSKSLSASLKNLGSSGDPSISIKGIEITGPNKDEFSAVAPSTTTLSPQASTSVSVKFQPQSLGIKNAALLVHYNNSSRPLRIPLYGIANTISSTITAVKRIKGAADANITIAGNVWEADKNYRQGSIKLDKQVVAGPIAATDDDVLYQTYLSASSDLAETRYAIPIQNGSYMVRMHFVENYFNGEGAREFNTTIENQLALPYFDIFKEVGYRSALVKDFLVNVTDGNLSIKFNPTINRVAIAGLEIYQASSMSAASVSTLSSAEGSGVLGNERSLMVHPNPTSSGSKFFVEVANFEEREALQITVHDITGQLITSFSAETDEQGACSKEVTVDGRLSQGIYFIRVVAPSGVMATKL
ncbi:MAG: choice-of-anchor D domain-containing protein, partial [Pontibacter sp.]|nr:choice-of-anchor D domain-containing protein [Pontibacter sp.]